ncbi:MAG: hypothetical protein KAQ99_07850 [Candidatus Aureabacteria bacterium]|nr:hypothetical protein [Candidatus Auribacterota bacterium]
MAAQLQELIERINKEGIKSAEEKTRKIIAEAEKKAEDIIEKAEKEAKALIEEAKKSAKSTQEKSEKAIKQSFRNVMLALKQEIAKQFDLIVKSEIGKALKPEVVSEVIINVSKDIAKQKSDGKDVQILVNEKDAKKLAGTFVESFKKEIQSGLEIKPVKNIDAGFMVSFDGGKSHYDFTDDGLRECLSAYISPQLKEIIK